MTPSPYQQAIYAWIVQGSGSAVISAVAGSGKTTTIVEATKLIPPGDRVLFLAFNKRIVTELVARLPQGVIAQTLNSLGHRVLQMRDAKRIQLDNRKVYHNLDEILPELVVRKHGGELNKLVGMAKVHGILPGDLDGFLRRRGLGLAYHHRLVPSRGR